MISQLASAQISAKSPAFSVRIAPSADHRRFLRTCAPIIPTLHRCNSFVSVQVDNSHLVILFSATFPDLALYVQKCSLYEFEAA